MNDAVKRWGYDPSVVDDIDRAFEEAEKEWQKKSATK